MASESATWQANDTPLALQRLDANDPEQRGKLEQTANSWLFHLEQGKRPRGLQYFENCSYLLGNHTTRYYYTSQHGFGTATLGGGDVSGDGGVVAKVADNKLIRPVETVGGMLTQSQPQPRVEPNSDLPEDEDAAELSELFLRLVYERPLNLPTKLRDAAKIAMICGTVAAETYYGESDIPHLVPKYKKARRKNPYAHIEGEPETFTEEVPDGFAAAPRQEVQCHLYTPFHITTDPFATNPDELSWVARTTYEDIDWIKNSFGDKEGEEGYFLDKLDFIRTENVTNHLLYWWLRFQDILESPQYYHHSGGTAPQSFTHSGSHTPNQTLFTVIDVKPSIEFPQGRTLVFAGGQLLYAGQARAWSEKYPWRWHPYHFFSWLRIPGRFAGVPMLSELVPLQKKINAIDALVHANRQFMSIGQWKIPKHSRVSEGRITGHPGVHIQYTDAPGMSGPEKVDHRPLPQELLIERDQLIKSIDDIAASSIVDANTGIAPSGARAGVMLDFLRAEKLRSKSGMLQDFEAFIEGISQNILIDIQLKMVEEDPDLTRRLVSAAREFSNQTIQAFTGASIRDHHAVKIDISSELLHSPEARQQRALEFWQYSQGQVSPAERTAVLKAAGLDEFMQSQQDMSLRRARRMVSRITQGDVKAFLPMDGIDDPAVMAPEFQKALLSDKIHDYPPEVTQTLLQAFDHYATAAAAQAQQQMQAQIAMAQAMKGGGGSSESE